MLVSGVSAMQGSDGGGCECHLSFVSSRGVVVVPVNAVCCLFQAGKWWWWARMPFQVVLSRGVAVVGMNAVVRFEQGSGGG